MISKEFSDGSYDSDFTNDGSDLIMAETDSATWVADTVESTSFSFEIER